MKKWFNKINHVAGAVSPDTELFGTRFDSFIHDIERAGYRRGVNRDSRGYVWYNYVGCSGYEFIRMTGVERIAAVRRARQLARTPVSFCDPFWSYLPEDKNYVYEGDNGTCTRNARLNRENRIEFLARMMSGR